MRDLKCFGRSSYKVLSYVYWWKYSVIRRQIVVATVNNNIFISIFEPKILLLNMTFSF